MLKSYLDLAHACCIAVVQVKAEGKSEQSIKGGLDESHATQAEVLTLRTQVAYLQDMIEDLRKQLDCVLSVIGELKSYQL